MTGAARFLERGGQPPQEAGFFWTGGPVEVAERTWFTSWFSGVTAFDTDEGLVLVDTGSAPAAPGMAAQVRAHTAAPVHTAVYTHGHIDHAYGLDAFLLPSQAEPRVIAHPGLPIRSERYVRTHGHNLAINHRQFGGVVPHTADPLGGIDFVAPPVPANTFVNDRQQVIVGGLTFDVHHARGETDDALWVHCPERSVVCTGDLFIWAVPNCGNPQKVQRYPADWASALRAMAALEPASLCPGHGGPVVDDAGLVEEMLLTTADYLETVVARTIEVLNDGSPPHVDVVSRVELPPARQPWLRNDYDDGEFIVRSVLRQLGGWWTGRPSELKPATRDAVAGEVAALAGGPEPLIARAEALVASGDARLACHLADWAMEAASDDPAIAERCARVYETRAEAEPSLMATNLFRSAAAYARAGRAFA